jgi:hypothetical protein
MKRFVVLIAAIAIVIALWTGAWFWAAGTAAGFVKSLETADGVSTPRVTCGSFAITGYPFGFDATCSDATIVSLDTTVTVKGLKATALVYNPFHVLAFAQSPVSYDDAMTGSRGRLDFADAEASARLTGWRIGRVSLVVNQPVWNDTILEDQLRAKAKSVALHLIDLPDLHDAAKGLSGLGESVTIKGLVAPLQGIADGEVTLEAAVSGLSDDLRTYGDGDLLRRWQGAGGTLKIVSFRGTDGTDYATTTGELSLDGQLCLQGQMKVASKGVVEQLGPLIPEAWKGWVLGEQEADGSYTQTLSFVAGVMFSGLVPLVDVPRLC